MPQIAILGGGISGIGAAYELGLRRYKPVIYEKKPTWGGLCNNFKVGDFLFDTAIHLSFSKNSRVQKLFAESTEYLSHKPISYNYFKGIWLRHPVQTNLNGLEHKLKIEMISSIIESQISSAAKQEIPKNYKEWLIRQFGEPFCQAFTFPYTRKYWTVEADVLSTSWVGERIYTPNVREILEGAFNSVDKNYYYAQEMRYPQKGGYKAFLSKMASACEIKNNKEVSRIDHKKKMLYFSDASNTHYEHLISSLPLPVLIDRLMDCPTNIKDCAKKLIWTQVALVSICLNVPIESKFLWFYIYDEDILASRGYFPSKKSPHNVPSSCGSLQFEIYHSPHKPLAFSLEGLREKVVDQGIKMKLFTRSEILDVDVRNLEYGNVVFDLELDQAKTTILNYLAGLSILSIGRFGQWDYFWSDQSLLSGIAASENLDNKLRS